MALFTSTLKTIVLLKRLTSERLGVGDDKVNRFGVNGSKKIAKKSRKLKS